MFLVHLAAQAGAFTLTTTPSGTNAHWETFPVEATVAKDTWKGVPGAVAAIGQGFRAWTDDKRGMSFDMRSTNDVPSIAADEVHHVWLTTDWPFDPDVIAMTDVWATTDGAIVAFEMRFDAGQPWATNGRPDGHDLAAAVAHEVGHLLGIEHSAVSDATMHPTAMLGDTHRRDLHDDDRDAVAVLYAPVDLAEAKSPVGCHTAPSTPMGTLGTGWIALVLWTLRRRPCCG